MRTRLLLPWWALAACGDLTPEPWAGTGGGTLIGDDDGGDGADGVPSDGTDGTDGTDGSDGTDATDGTDGTDATDGTDTGEPGAGLGSLSGACGVLDAAVLADPAPALFTNAIDFGDVGYDAALLTPGGQEIWDDGNLGGSSLYSEVVAFEVLNRCEGAALLKTEGEITYSDPDSKKTDLLVDFSGVRIGVSVTRAVGWPREDPWTVEQAEDLLADKLADIPLSTAAVSAEDAWSRQILSVIAWSPDHAAAIETAWLTLDAALTLDTIVYVTATDGDDAFVYE